MHLVHAGMCYAYQSRQRWLLDRSAEVHVLSDAAEAAKEAEYLVKWTGKSHAHNEWVPESTLAKLAKRKLANFKRRHGGAPCCLAEDTW